MGNLEDAVQGGTLVLNKIVCGGRRGGKGSVLIGAGRVVEREADDGERKRQGLDMIVSEAGLRPSLDFSS